MPYELAVQREAERAFAQDKKRRQQEGVQHKERAYALCPRLVEIDQTLRSTVPLLVKLALDKASEDSFDSVQQQNMALQEERRSLLHKLQITPSDLGDVPVCDLCDDHGWIGRQMCSCLEDYCVAVQMLSLDKLLQGNRHSFQNFSLDYYSPQAWVDSPASPRENMGYILEYCQRYANLSGELPLKNVIFTGSPGLGKTFLAGCLARELTKQGKWVMYGTAEEIFQAFQIRQFRKNHQEEYMDAQNTTKGYLSCDFLVIDDLGSEFTTNFSDTSLYELVNTRLLAGLHTAITTNQSMAELAKRYPPQVLSRIHGDYAIMNFYGEDIRQQKKM